MDAQQKKAAILDALLEHKGIEHVMSAASRVLNNPILMVDRLGVYAGTSITGAFGEDYWSRFITNMPHDQMVEEVERRGISARLLASDALQLEYFDSSNRDVLGTRVRDRVDVLGYVGMPIENPIEPDDGTVLVALARMLAVELVYQSHQVSRRDDDSVLIQGLLDGTVGERELPPIERRLGIDREASMRLACVSYPPSHDTSLFLAKNAIEANADCLICGVAKGSVVVVVDDAASSESFLSVLRHCAQGCIGIGLSWGFGSLAALPEAYEQACSALRISTALGKKDDIFSYERVVPYSLVETASRFTDIAAFIDPAVLRLRDYDSENGSELSKTLRSYIESGRNMNACAESLFTHRNTVYYRLKRIGELAGIDFEDADRCFSIWLSFVALDMAAPESMQAD